MWIEAACDEGTTLDSPHPSSSFSSPPPETSSESGGVRTVSRHVLVARIPFQLLQYPSQQLSVTDGGLAASGKHGFTSTTPVNVDDVLYQDDSFTCSPLLDLSAAIGPCPLCSSSSSSSVADPMLSQPLPALKTKLNQVQAAVTSQGCWLLVPPHTSHLNPTIAGTPPTHCGSCAGVYSIQYVDFSTGLFSELVELSNPLIASCAPSGESTHEAARDRVLCSVSLLLLDENTSRSPSAATRVHSRDTPVCSSVLVVYEYQPSDTAHDVERTTQSSVTQCHSQPQSKSQSTSSSSSLCLCMSRVSYFNGELLVQGAVFLPALPSFPSMTPSAAATTATATTTTTAPCVLPCSGPNKNTTTPSTATVAAAATTTTTTEKTGSTLVCACAARVVSLRVAEGVLFILREGSLVYTSLAALIAFYQASLVQNESDEEGKRSPSADTVGAEVLWSVSMTSSTDHVQGCVGFWILQSSSQQADTRSSGSSTGTDIFRGTLPSHIGVYIGSNMFNIAVNHPRLLAKARRAGRKGDSERLKTRETSQYPWNSCRTKQQHYVLIPPLEYLNQQQTSVASRLLSSCSGTTTSAERAPASPCPSPSPRPHVLETASPLSVSRLVEVVSLMDDRLACHCCQTCGCAHIHASPVPSSGSSRSEEQVRTVASSWHLSSLLSDNDNLQHQHQHEQKHEQKHEHHFSHQTPHEHRSSYQKDAQSQLSLAVTCDQKLADYFAAGDSDTASIHEGSHVRPFDLNDFVASVESCPLSSNSNSNNCYPLTQQSNVYLEKALQYLLLRQEKCAPPASPAPPAVSEKLDPSAELLDFSLVVLHIAFCLDQTKAPSCICVGSSTTVKGKKKTKGKEDSELNICACSEATPSMAYNVVRRCLKTVLEFILAPGVLLNMRDKVPQPSTTPFGSYHWGGCQAISHLLEELKTTTCIQPSKENLPGLPVAVTRSHQDLVLQLLALSGDVLSVVELLDNWERFEDLFCFVQELLCRFHSHVRARGIEGSATVSVLVSPLSSQRKHICGRQALAGGDLMAVQMGEGEEEKKQQAEEEKEEEEGEDRNESNEDDDGWGGTWVTTGNDEVSEESEEEEEEEEESDYMSVSDGGGTTTTPAGLCGVPAAHMVLSDAAVTTLALHYPALLRHALFAAMFLNDMERVKGMYDQAVWTLCLPTLSASQPSGQLTEQREVLQKRLFLLEIMVDVKNRGVACGQNTCATGDGSRAMDEFIDSVVAS